WLISVSLGSLLVVKSVIGAIWLLSIPVANAAEPGTSIYPLTGSIYVVEDSHYAKTNYVVYIGAASVTVIGAGWSPDTAELLEHEIKKVTDKPVRDVVLPDHDPEYAGGVAYWKRIGASVVSTELTEQILRSDWSKTADFTRKYFPAYPSLPLVLPTKTYKNDFELENGAIRGFYLGPSHNADDIFIYFPKEKVLYAGSILKEHLGNLAFADLEEYPKTLQKLKDLHLAIDKIISGHWSAVHGANLIDQYLGMLKEHSETGD
ncbi:MAG TPA: subclass B2 metallo-beta-lactamase, partial [Candidatus Udaeobacter sp.]|nr:subclass B2 metallo-beta-lactamase [Candidatus Udaeobacter sp.]